ncbi:MAG: hypothetical protein J5486_04320 [Bacteroidaceae bacterium]|nr:hypothetical protein [Bacteroidaceae bacterium]
MRRLLSIMAVLLLLGGTATAQRQSLSLFGNRKPTRKVLNTQQASRPLSNPQLQTGLHSADGRRNRLATVQTAHRDTACYLALSKTFGWYQGIGQKLTADEASRMPCYFRLTEPDSLGRFTHIEALNGHGALTSNHNLSTYLMTRNDASDEDADSLWRAMMQTVVQWQLYPAADSRLPVMESGYDADGNLIYNYLMKAIDDSLVVGHYTDAYGEPIALRKGENEAQFVQMGLDSMGYERQICYISKDANYMRNSDGAYMTRYDYDADGNIVRCLSCLMTGQPMLDSWGNCGYIADYNDRGQVLHKRYLDQHLLPMRMPLYRAGAIDVMSRNFVYQDYRLIDEYYLTDDGHKDKTKYGIHRRHYDYDEHGDLLRTSSYDTDGELCNDSNGIAQTLMTYDNQGRMLTRSFLDNHQLLRNDPTGTYLYMGENRYATSNGIDTIPLYVVENSGYEQRTIDRRSDLVTVRRTDTQGRVVELAYYNMEGQPVEVDSCFRQLTSYSRQASKLIQTDIHYSFNDTTRTVTITDTRDHTRIVQTFRGSTLLSTFGQTLDESLQEITGQYGYDALGNRARSHLEDALYYRVVSGTTYRGQTSYMMGRNEYGEPSYVSSSESTSSDIYCTKIFKSDGTSVLLDEDNQPITDVKSFRSTRGRLYCIELTSQRAYDIGLRSGDIIVRYGAFTYPEVSTDVWEPRDNLQMGTFLSRKERKELVVLRFDSRTGQHRPVELTLPKGSPSELGFIIQTVLCTNSETERYNRLVSDYLMSHELPQDNLGFGENDEKVVLIRPFKISTATMTSWRQGMTNDVIVLGMINQDLDGTRSYCGIADGFRKMWNQVTAEADSVIVFFTEDGRSVQSVMLPGTGSATNTSSSEITESDYNELQDLEQTSLVPLIDGMLERSMLSPVNCVLKIRRLSTSEMSYNFSALSSFFPRFLELLSVQTGVDFKDKGITLGCGASANATTKEEDIRIIHAFISRADLRGYEQVSDDEKTVYYRRSAVNPQELLEAVVASQNYILVFQGNITLSPTEILQGHYDKLH